jgi:restriction endonuclease
MLLTPEEMAHARLVALTSPDHFTLHVGQHFHLLLPSGFDEVCLAPGEDLDDLDHEKLSRDLAVDVLRPNENDDISCGNLVWWRFQRMQFREKKSGTWYRWVLNEWPIMDKSFKHSRFLDAGLIFAARPGAEPLKLRVRDILQACQNASKETEKASVILFPSIWTGTTSEAEMRSDWVRLFLKGCTSGAGTLSDLSWRQMEELVAELLKLQGMEVTVTPGSGDGGRDIIARGELIPGEPTVLAVEVKHKPVVGLQDARSALYANRQMPALLIATSGRFSAGVLREAQTPDNRYRLFLKDGIGLQQWVSASWQRLVGEDRHR